MEPKLNGGRLAVLACVWLVSGGLLAMEDTGAPLPPRGERTVLHAPDVMVTGHIRSFSPGEYFQHMRQARPNPWRQDGPLRWPSIFAGLVGLNLSSNPEPPERFTPREWESFVASREYRALARIRDFSIQCSAGVVQPLEDAGDQPEPAAYTPAQSEYNYAFTRFLVAGPVRVFLDGQPYVGPAFTNGFTGQLTRSGACYRVTDARALRMSSEAQTANFMLYDFDAPYIWTRVSVELCCDGSGTARLESSHFPTHRLYVDGVLVAQEAQDNWLQFVLEGGPKGTRAEDDVAPLVAAGRVLVHEFAGPVAGGGETLAARSAP